MNTIVGVRTAATLAIALAIASVVAPANAQEYGSVPGPYGPPAYGYGPGPYGYGSPVPGYGPGPYAYGPPGYGNIPRYFRYRGNSPDDYPVGSGDWWRAMDREGRAGQGGD